jgi:methionine synthase II (cobalamin-independent)
MHLNPPFRAEHIGSLKRPAYLLEARSQFEADQASYEELRPVEQKAIQEIVRLQKEIGLKVVTDGEFTRSVFAGYRSGMPVRTHQILR